MRKKFTKEIYKEVESHEKDFTNDSIEYIERVRLYQKDWLIYLSLMGESKTFIIDFFKSLKPTVKRDRRKSYFEKYVDIKTINEIIDELKLNGLTFT